MPQGFPVWLWVCLGAVLPLIYQGFVKRLPGFLKWAVAWGLSALITIVVGFVFLGYSPGELLAAFVWIVSSSQAVYALMVKPLAELFRRDSTKLRLKQ